MDIAKLRFLRNVILKEIAHLRGLRDLLKPGGEEAKDEVIEGIEGTARQLIILKGHLDDLLGEPREENFWASVRRLGLW